MTWMNLELVIFSIAIGAGLAMDAFSVSLADGLAEPEMKKPKMLAVSGTFAFFQFAMPLIGWVVVHKAVQGFNALEKFIPWIALILLLYIGGKMLREGIADSKSASDAGESEGSSCMGDEKSSLGLSSLVVQGIATSIDALSVGFTIEKYNFQEALAASTIIGIVTLGICIVGLILGKKIGTKLAGKAAIFGGAILVIIGLEIWVKGVLL